LLPSHQSFLRFVQSPLPDGRLRGVGGSHSPPLSARFIPFRERRQKHWAHAEAESHFACSPSRLRGFAAFPFPPPEDRQEMRNTDSQRSGTRCGAPTDDSPQRELWVIVRYGPEPRRGGRTTSPTLSPEARFIPFRERQQNTVLAQRRRDAEKTGRLRSSPSSRLRVFACGSLQSGFCLTRSREGDEEFPGGVPSVSFPSAADPPQKSILSSRHPVRPSFAE
jgi:hypothetical protein